MTYFTSWFGVSIVVFEQVIASRKCIAIISDYNPANIYLFKVSKRNTRKRCEMCSELTMKTPETGTICVFYSVGKANYIVISKYISVLTMKVIRLFTFFYKILLNKPETRLNFFLPPPLPPFISNGTRHFFHPFS